MKARTKILQKIINYILLITTFIFLGNYLINNLPAIKIIRLSFSWINFIIATLVCFVFYFNLSNIWYYLTKKLSCNLDFFKSFQVWNYSNIAKYIPGKIFSYIVLFNKYNENAISKIPLLYASAIDAMGNILYPSTIFFISQFFCETKYFQSHYYYLYLAIACICLVILLHPRVILLIIRLFYRKDHVYTQFKPLPFKLLVSIYLMNILNLFLFSLSFFFLINSFTTLKIDNFFNISASISFAGLLGFISFFAPAGIGVREGALIFSLSYTISNSFAIIVSLFSRLWMVLIEIIIYSLSHILFKIYPSGKISKVENSSSNDLDEEQRNKIK